MQKKRASTQASGVRTVGFGVRRGVTCQQADSCHQTEVAPLQEQRGEITHLYNYFPVVLNQEVRKGS